MVAAGSLSRASPGGTRLGHGPAPDAAGDEGPDFRWLSRLSVDDREVGEAGVDDAEAAMFDVVDGFVE